MVDAKGCLFCRIIRGEVPVKKVYEDVHSLAFLDINPRNPGHTLIIPKKHYETLFDMPDSEGGLFFISLKRVAGQVKKGTQSQGLSVCQNNGSAAGQVVAHLHFHLIPRFMNEGPSALEAFLPIKKMDERSLDTIASSIKGTSASSPQTVEEEEKPPKAEKSEEKKKRSDEEDDDFEEIDFNL